MAPAALALALHVAVFCALALVRAPLWIDREPIRLSLLAERGSAATAAPAPAAAASAAQPLAIPARKAVVKSAAPAPRAKYHPAPPLTEVDGATDTNAGAASQSSGLGGSGAGMGDGKGQRDGLGGGAGGDQRPFCVSCPEPEYPMIARRRGWNGSVDVDLVLLADGKVDQAQVARSSGYDELDREAVAAARQSRFRMPTEHSAPVRGRIEYRFELKGAR